ncbi:hypothetical protein AQUCO_00300304v1 [Aquilegia coerulea]|uniref:FAM192A/Fyv6 N-terminal domain-containing protein n=1 Tax=Aquilegia coerulea TaxID=218851 RepID=A0A2G5EY44_AQUCA|nr:hypothetical protein AQUCO_00300304v1 [Aquilegia coerulea]
MAEENGVGSIRLMSFVSEEQLDEAKKNRGERVEDGTAQRDKPLFEILKENKDKKDAEFNERFKHRPPKALDEDETEFLDNIEMEYERQVADEEAQQLRSFQKAVAAQSSTVHELKETPSVPKIEEAKPLARKNPPAGPLGGLVIKVKPQAKKAKIDNAILERPSESDTTKPSNGNIVGSSAVDKGALVGLVSYGDESEDEEDDK